MIRSHCPDCGRTLDACAVAPCAPARAKLAEWQRARGMIVDDPFRGPMTEAERAVAVEWYRKALDGVPPGAIRFNTSAAVLAMLVERGGGFVDPTAVADMVAAHELTRRVMRGERAP